MTRVTEDDLESQDDGRVLYQGLPYTGEVAELAGDGTVVAVVSYERGREHGPWREWYPDGRLKVAGRVEYGKGAVGTWRTWHPNGRLAERHDFDGDGRLRGVRRWDAEGNLVESRDYLDPP
ncbi:toxin-antitoxin system YwqK family antitoxin [Streptomonospora nanhaiensis]|uniref:Antitoxin component YwqK of YwqJK toxin-antitoxin module n=1 Tax=Streptomonospora nanhaiensis TaxID=1323731 RepID=A0A853BWN9_9ACTN|nr:hypothetical protein [Streptomonospora nanhaiensis]MBV2363586.1 hypothetical protein [Streptomonospora nanhaiensis]MBX9389574.1 hypothetical protein [Streptomonospora nanhaiensis]NYI98602.1 antitoxin component YwqK of YwqJK toxin-antitoxin module [Streptomonospora nanhaiensis]